MATPKSWKNVERFVCRALGGDRRGANTGFGTVGEGKSDCVGVDASVEVKLNARPSFQFMVDACKQAEDAREESWHPAFAVIKKKGSKKKDTLVCFRWEEFLKLWEELTTDPSI